MCPGVPYHLQRFPKMKFIPAACLSLHAHATFTKDPKASEGAHATCVKRLPGISKDHMRGRSSLADTVPPSMPTPPGRCR